MYIKTLIHRIRKNLKKAHINQNTICTFNNTLELIYYPETISIFYGNTRYRIDIPDDNIRRVVINIDNLEHQHSFDDKRVYRKTTWCDYQKCTPGLLAEMKIIKHTIKHVTPMCIQQVSQLNIYANSLNSMISDILDKFNVMRLQSGYYMFGNIMTRHTSYSNNWKIYFPGAVVILHKKYISIRADHKNHRICTYNTLFRSQWKLKMLMPLIERLYWVIDQGVCCCKLRKHG